MSDKTTQVDNVSVYIHKSWVAPFRNTDMDNQDAYNGVAVVQTAWGQEMVRAFEAHEPGKVLLKIFEAVHYWNDVGMRPVVVDSIYAKGEELTPHVVWGLVSKSAERLGADKWALKRDVDSFAYTWKARQTEQKQGVGEWGEPVQMSANEPAQAWSNDPRLIPPKGDKY